MVAVTFCIVLNFSTSLITSAKVWESFLYTFPVMLCTSQRPSAKMPIVGGSVAVEVTSFSFHFETMHLGFQCLIVLQIDFHKLAHVGVYVCITEFHMEDILDVVPTLASLKCFANKGVDQAM